MSDMLTHIVVSCRTLREQDAPTALLDDERAAQRRQRRDHLGRILRSLRVVEGA